VSAEDKNKAIVRRFVEAHAKGDLDALMELLAPDFVDHRPILTQEPGREGYIQAVARRNAAFSDIRFDIEEQMAAEDNRVVCRLTLRLSHDRSEIAGFAPTNREYEMTHIAIYRIEGGKIA